MGGFAMSDNWTLGQVDPRTTEPSDKWEVTPRPTRENGPDPI